MFVGSFNQSHTGHEQVVRTALKFCDKLYVCVAVNPEKVKSQDFDIRLRRIRQGIQDFVSSGRVVVRPVDGLVVDFCSENNIGLIIKGCRNPSDFEKERTQANINKKLYSAVDTVLIPTPPEVEDISSTLVRTLVQFGAPITGYVSPSIEEDVVKHFRNT